MKMILNYFSILVNSAVEKKSSRSSLYLPNVTQNKIITIIEQYAAKIGCLNIKSRITIEIGINAKSKKANRVFIKNSLKKRFCSVCGNSSNFMAQVYHVFLNNARKKEA